MVSITAEQIMRLAPGARPNYKQAFLTADAVLAKYQINTTGLRVAHFMAQVLHESGLLKIQEEILDYKTTERLNQVWPERFPKVKGVKAPADPYPSGEPFLHNPPLLGDKAYFGRMGNVVAQDDGFTYRGRGLIQITGREDYEYYGRKIGIDLVGSPELAFDSRYAMEVAAAEWNRKSCNSAADMDKIDLVTRKINGGNESIDARRKLLIETKKVWLPQGTNKPASVAVHHPGKIIPAVKKGPGQR